MLDRCVAAAPQPVAQRILVVEDEADLAELLALHLRDLCQEVVQAADGRSGLALAQNGDFDLIVLDLMLPGLDGLELCRRLRRAPPHTPILMLTAKSTEGDRVLGIESGADDYLCKPFSILELLARVKAILRRAALVSVSAADSPVLRRGALKVDTERHRVWLADALLELTAKEYELLLYFCRHSGRVYTRAQLLDAVWGLSHEAYEHTVSSHICRLRAKIETDPAAPRYIETVWGVGYRFAETP